MILSRLPAHNVGRKTLIHPGSTNRGQTREVTCDCGAEGLTDHSRHVAEEIVDRLGLSAEHVRGEMRYVSAWFDRELTTLEGAE